MPNVPWPNNAKVAVNLTFDFDAETLWLSRDPANIDRPGTLSQGTYGAKVGVPKILELLSSEGLPATFFVPGWVVDNRTHVVEKIIKAGHEIAHHGYLHKAVDPKDPELELEELETGIEAIKRVVGIAPVGYRAPSGETSPNLVRLLSERGFLYDSSMTDDVEPYCHFLQDGSPSLVELPWHWSLDDAQYLLSNAKTHRPIQTNEHILSIWKAEFHEAYLSGGYFNLLMHPQVTGRPSRVRMLSDFIAYVRKHDNVWFAQSQDVANAWLQIGPKQSAEPMISPFLKVGQDGTISQC
ncbi:polysaccharide deacetylase [Bradyrhizobium canariense]|uniref:polysaccharide deacetylase family protein n=1 Tax=Bradyrhizobium TaxID=374 RepID=UPI000A18B411|nr:polysaccharide deacetylase [Bradyrhizobium canariense]OSI30540.1 ribulose phosphate epimerase [Bradyrhizobium canariense]OSI37301.1 ribulose phosphate epimerase [Bradyrhizobium canariense]OSI52021.1 ribulose phosphate epimerase [Bradyrhizobium canariense]OSI56324.1 ribulose phosphate epimerase [Bradyrhizobium canariense]OSI59396.1 ribulose phosphate epimerase [Bradyrhizobium canariense]